MGDCKKKLPDNPETVSGRIGGIAKDGDKELKQENLITDACIKIALNLNYTIEEVLDHNIDWMNLMLKKISIEEFENNMFQMALHGVDRARIDQLRADFYSDINPDSVQQKRQISINEFRIMGLSVGKENKTVVKR